MNRLPENIGQQTEQISFFVLLFYSLYLTYNLQLKLYISDLLLLTSNSLINTKYLDYGNTLRSHL